MTDKEFIELEQKYFSEKRKREAIDKIEETFFYDFAVQRYDLRFSYKGVDYYFLSEQDYAAQCEEHFTNEIRRFKDGNAVLEEFEIDGKKLIELIPLIEDCEVY